MMMQIIFTNLLFVSVVILQCNSVQISVYGPDDSLHDIYLKINSHLVKQVATDDTQANISKLLEMLDVEQNRRFKCINLLYNQRWVDALKQLEAFASILDGRPACNHREYDILRAVDRGTGGSAHRTFKRDCHGKEELPIRRLDKIIYRYSMKHAKYCRGAYVIPFRKSYNIMDKKPLEGLMATLDRIMAEWAHEDPELDPTSEKYIESLLDHRETNVPYGYITRDWFDNSTTREFLYKELTLLAKDDPNAAYLKPSPDEDGGKMIFFRKLFLYLYYQYLENPCKLFMANLDYLKLAEYDELMFEHEKRYRPYDKDLLDFYRNIVRFRMCNEMVKRRQLKDELAEIASKQC